MVTTHVAVLLEFLDRYNEGAWEQLDGLTTAGYVHHNNDLWLTLAQFKAGAAWFRKGMPDFRIEVEEMVTERDHVAVRITAQGTHRVSMFGEAPTHRSVTLHGQVMYRFEGGLIAEDWETMDEFDLRKQIGAVPSEA